MNNSNRIFLNKIVNDDIYIDNKIVSLEHLTGIQPKKGMERCILSGDKIVNIVSQNYGHLPNTEFFPIIESQLQDEGIQFLTRSINRGNSSFAVDYIIEDENLNIFINNGMDKIKPMLRFTNSYDGSTKTCGYFGFYREVCSNGLHVAETKIGFSIKHTNSIKKIVLPQIKKLLHIFMNNEFFTIKSNFDLLAETPVYDVEDFVKMTAESLELFNYVSSEKNPSPSLNARLVMEIMESESAMLEVIPNLWIGYNAFNSVLHNKLKKPFGAQKKLDAKIFNHILETVN